MLKFLIPQPRMSVIPAKAGIQFGGGFVCKPKTGLDSLYCRE